MSDRNPAHLYPDFRAKYLMVVDEVNTYLVKHYPGLTCKLVEGFRTAEYQHSLWQQGRDSHGNKIGSTVTNCDGYKAKSDHQSSMAADLGVFDAHGDYIEEPASAIWDFYAHCLRSHGLKAGRDWHHQDDPHGEWDPADKAMYTRAQAWQKQNGLV